MNPKTVIERALGGMIDSTRRYHQPLPPELAKWYVYTLDGGHCIACVLAQMAPAIEDDPAAAARFIVAIPVRTVLRLGFKVVGCYVVVSGVPYDKFVGANVPDADWEHDAARAGLGCSSRENSYSVSDPGHPSRNAPCPCGSGRKCKNCCDKRDQSRHRSSQGDDLGAGGDASLNADMMQSLRLAKQQALTHGVSDPLIIITTAADPLGSRILRKIAPLVGSGLIVTWAPRAVALAALKDEGFGVEVLPESARELLRSDEPVTLWLLNGLYFGEWDVPEV